MANERDTYVYRLKQGRKVVYIGTSKNPDRRESEHAANKQFDSMVVARYPRTAKGAKQEEARQLATYRKGHEGQNPFYNKDCDG